MDSWWSPASVVKDKFSYLFKATSYLLRPYLKLKYEPKENRTWEDYLLQLLVYISTWIVVLILYVLFIYLSVFTKEDGTEGKFSDFYTRPPLELYNDILASILVSPFFKITFLLILYFAITFHAEKVYLESKVLHLRISGLIKVLTLGKFDISSCVSEQHEDQVNTARTNIYNTVNDNTKELITIVSASGWDLFGNPQPKTEAPIEENAPKTILKKYLKKKNYEDGYLNEVIAQQFRKVQIVLLDPNGTTVKNRAECYLKDGAHKPITEVEKYQEGINAVISNIKLAYKKNKNIELKLIDKLPEWKIVIVEGEVWTQPIIQGVRSDHTPLYGFKKTEYSMYHTFWNISESIWHDPTAKIQDLSK